MRSKEISVPFVTALSLLLASPAAADGRGSAEAIRSSLEATLKTLDTDCRDASSANGTRYFPFSDGFELEPREDPWTPLEAPNSCGCKQLKEDRTDAVDGFQCEADRRDGAGANRVAVIVRKDTSIAMSASRGGNNWTLTWSPDQARCEAEFKDNWDHRGGGDYADKERHAAPARMCEEVSSAMRGTFQRLFDFVRGRFGK